MTRDEAIERMERAVREYFPENAEEILDALHLPRPKTAVDLACEVVSAAAQAKAAMTIAQSLDRYTRMRRATSRRRGSRRPRRSTRP